MTTTLASAFAAATIFAITRYDSNFFRLRLLQTMLTLTLFRHAKSSWDVSGKKDIDRPLSDRGSAAAPVMGTYMANEQLAPDLVLCSPAARTRATSALAFAALAPPPQIVFEAPLYLASVRTLLARIRRVDATVRHLMIVGHNPGLQSLALELIGKGNSKPLADLSDKLPTAGLVMLEFDHGDWAKVGPGTARLARFVTPRMLMA